MWSVYKMNSASTTVNVKSSSGKKNNQQVDLEVSEYVGIYWKLTNDCEMILISLCSWQEIFREIKTTSITIHVYQNML